MEEQLMPSRRGFMGGVLLLSGLIDADGDGHYLDDLLGEDESPTGVDIFVREDPADLEEVDVAADRLLVATSSGAVYRPSDAADEWVRIETTGENPIFKSAIISDLKTKNIGVSASQSSDLSVPTGTETRLAIDDTSHPYFDDFGELDADANKIVLKHASHHEIVAHASLSSATNAGQIWLRIYVNGVERAHDHINVKNGEEGVLETSIPLKLQAGDQVEAKVEHDTGSTETFGNGNFLSCIRQ